MRLDKGEIVLLSTFLIVFCAFVATVVFVASRGQSLHSTWPESVEFSQIMTGQERFSEHATNVDGLTVVVDHETGVQYLADDFARAICDALIMLVGTAMTLVVVAGYAAYVVLVYWWRQLILAAAIALIATIIVHMC